MKTTLLTILLISITAATFAQQGTGLPTAYQQQKFFDSTSYVLPLLFKAAMKNAPEIKRADAASKIADIDLKQSKNEILKQFYINGNYNFGSTPNYINAVQTTSFNAFNQNGRALYLVGINLNISLEQIFGGIHQRVSKQKLVVEEVQAESRIAESGLRVKIISYYNALVLSKKLFEHAEDALQSAYVNKQLVDKQFKAQEVKVTDEMAANDLYAHAVVDEQQAKSTYQLNIMLLEETIGMKLNQFINDNIK